MIAVFGGDGDGSATGSVCLGETLLIHAGNAAVTGVPGNLGVVGVGRVYGGGQLSRVTHFQLNIPH